MKGKTDMLSIAERQLNDYLSPQICVVETEVETGFATSLKLESPEDDGLPQIKGVDNWDGWE